MLLFTQDDLVAQCWAMVSGGTEHTLAIKADGSLWAWGKNDSGQLGDGTTSDRSYPTQIGNQTNWLQVSAGNKHNLGIKKDGTLWAWGANNFGQLGDETFNNRLEPVLIDNRTNWSQVSAGGYHSIALLGDSDLFAWGSNFENGVYYGQVGNGIPENINYPIQILESIPILQISAGWFFTQMLTEDGHRWAWGGNVIGYLGNGSTNIIDSPTMVDNESWTWVQAGFSHCCGIKTDGTLWTWGFNGFGQLGTGNTDSSLSPVQVGTSNTWEEVYPGTYHSISRKSDDGSIWTWGRNQFGELGIGHNNPSYNPSQISDFFDFSKIETGHVHNILITQWQDLYAWGYNECGQVGDTTMTDRNLPIKISCDPGDIIDSDDPKIKRELKLFPNPSKDGIIYISSSDSALSYKIFNVDGKCLLYNQNFVSIIDLNPFDPGMYFIQILDENTHSVLTETLIFLPD